MVHRTIQDYERNKEVACWLECHNGGLILPNANVLGLCRVDKGCELILQKSWVVMCHRVPVYIRHLTLYTALKQWKEMEDVGLIGRDEIKKEIWISRNVRGRFGYEDQWIGSAKLFMGKQWTCPGLRCFLFEVSRCGIRGQILIKWVRIVTSPNLAHKFLLF